jgi:hypothetical protein
MDNFLGKEFSCELELQVRVAKTLNKLSQHKFNFQKIKATWCDIADVIHGIYGEIKIKKWKDGVAQLLYGVFRKYGQNGEKEFHPSIFCFGDKSEIRFYISPSYETLKDFYNKVDPTGQLSPSDYKVKQFNEEALNIIGEPIHINDYINPLNLEEPNIYITTKTIFQLITRFEKYNVDIRELIVNIADVYEKNGRVLVSNDGRTITNDVNMNKIMTKRIRPEDKSYIEKLRVTPLNLKKLRNHFDEYEAIMKRRNLGKFFTTPALSTRIYNTIISHIPDPSFILDPYAGTGSLCVPFMDYTGLMNDISKTDIDIAKMAFEGTTWEFDNIDCIARYSAGDLVERWRLKERWTEKSVIYMNPPFGTAATGTKMADSSIKKGESRKIKIKYQPELLKYGKGDLMLPAIGQQIEVIKKLGNGYLAFFCPVDVFCGRKRYNLLLKELLSNFTFCEGIILRGDEFNNVNKEKPIAFTIWKFGGYTKHLNLEFDFYGKNIKLDKGNLLKDGWKTDRRDGQNGELMTSPKEYFSHPSPPMFHSTPKSGGSRVIPENVKKDIHFDNFPSEMIYALWSTTVAKTFGNTAVTAPVFFMGASTHIPADFSTPDNQKILVYSILWTLVNELNHLYTNGNIGFTSQKTIKFGTPTQSKAVQDLLEKYKNEPCMNTTVEQVVSLLSNKGVKGKFDKELRADLKKRLSDLLDKIGYWDKIIVPEVLTYQEEINKKFGVKP